MADYVNTEFERRYLALTPLLGWSGRPTAPTVGGMAEGTEEDREFALRVGALIAGQRLAQDLSQEDLAERIGVSVSTLGRWERGVNAPKTYQAGRVIRALGIDPMLFLDPPDVRSDMDRAIAAAVGSGLAAASLPRRRATRRGADGPAEPPAPRQPRGH